MTAKAAGISKILQGPGYWWFHAVKLVYLESLEL